MQWKTITATVMRKGDAGGRRYLIVRSFALAVDKVVAVSQEDYEHLDAGMIVTVRQMGWGPFSTWRLKQ